jgi:hypothetical protein
MFWKWGIVFLVKYWSNFKLKYLNQNPWALYGRMWWILELSVLLQFYHNIYPWLVLGNCDKSEVEKRIRKKEFWFLSILLVHEWQFDK